MRIRLHFVSYNVNSNNEPVRKDSFYLNLSDAPDAQAQQTRIGDLGTIMSQRMSAKHRVAIRFDAVEYLDGQGGITYWDTYDWKSLVSDDYFDHIESEDEIDPEILDAENHHGQDPHVCEGCGRACIAFICPDCAAE